MSETKLNQTIIEIVADNILTGVSIASVAALLGISPRVYYYWLKQGDQDIDNEVESVYAELAESVLAAEAKVEQRLLDQAIGTVPIGVRWYLSRKFRGDSMCINHITIQHYPLGQLVDVHYANLHLPSINTFG